MKKITLPFICLFFTVCTNAQLIAFPGAEGYGKYSTGGRGGKVVEVTTLQDSIPGSLRWALDQYVDTLYVYRDAANPSVQITSYQPLTVVFKVSGIISLKSDLKIKRDNLTIAGQTAPCDGICIKDHSVLINGATGAQLFYWGPRRKNVIIRHIRFRPGIPRDVNGTPTSSFVTYGLDVENYENVIVDHCSISWANEECLATYDTKNVTFQWNIVSEGLDSAYHPKGYRAYGGVWGGQFATYHHNLIAHQNSRTPRYNGSRAHDTIALVDYRNNVNYNWLTSSAPYGGEVEINGGISRINIINNFYKPGPATPSTQKIARPDYTMSSRIVSMWHVEGNIIEGNATRTADNWQAVDFASIPIASRDSAKSDSTFIISEPIVTKTAQEAYDSVLAYVGAIYPKRDAVDTRVVNEVKTKTSSATGYRLKPGIIDDPVVVGGWPVFEECTAVADSDHDGMPDEWETANASDPNNEEDRNNIDPVSGYTMLEVYLNRLAAGYKPVPVKMISFTAKTKEYITTLYWSMANESNNKGWFIEKCAVNSAQWNELGFVNGSLNSQNQTTYSFTDNNFSEGSFMYRLKQVDLNGNISYSNILVVKNESGSKTLSISNFPNPFFETTTIKYVVPTAGKVKISLLNGQGQLISHLVDGYETEGIYQKMINTHNLSAGKYLIRLEMNGKIITSSLVKSK